MKDYNRDTDRGAKSLLTRMARPLPEIARKERLIVFLFFSLVNWRGINIFQTKHVMYKLYEGSERNQWKNLCVYMTMRGEKAKHSINVRVAILILKWDEISGDHIPFLLYKRKESIGNLSIAMTRILFY